MPVLRVTGNPHEGSPPPAKMPTFRVIASDRAGTMGRKFAALGKIPETTTLLRNTVQ